MEWIRFYMMGLSVLVVAILANYLAIQWGLKTWYAFLDSWGNGQPLKLKDLLWLYVLYPLFLGVGARLGSLLWGLFF
jgi:hypothetical protein